MIAIEEQIQLSDFLEHIYPAIVSHVGFEATGDTDLERHSAAHYASSRNTS